MVVVVAVVVVVVMVDDVFMVGEMAGSGVLALPQAVESAGTDGDDW